MIKMEMIGRLGRDAVIRHSDTGKSVISFSVAHDIEWTDGNGVSHKKTIWVKANYWRDKEKLKIAEYLKKGTQVYMEGTPEPSAYIPEGATQPVAQQEIKVRWLKLLGSPKANDEETKQQTSESQGEPFAE